MTTKLADEDQVAVWQAEGVVMELLGCDAAVASLLLRCRAVIQKRRVFEVAAAVLSEVTTPNIPLVVRRRDVPRDSLHRGGTGTAVRSPSQDE